jgi:hypothetical protein
MADVWCVLRHLREGSRGLRWLRKSTTIRTTRYFDARAIPDCSTAFSFRLKWEKNSPVLVATASRTGNDFVSKRDTYRTIKHFAQRSNTCQWLNMLSNCFFFLAGWNTICITPKHVSVTERVAVWNAICVTPRHVSVTEHVAVWNAICISFIIETIEGGITQHSD